MAQRYGTAVHVDFFGVELELARHGNCGDGKRFVQLHEIDILVAVPSGFLEQLLDRVHGRHHHPLGLHAAHRLRHDARDGLLPQSRSVALARDDQGRRAVIRSRSVACRHRAVFLERRLQFRQRFQRSVLAGRFVVLDDQGVAFFLRNFEGQNLRFEEAGLARANGFLVAFHCKSVLFFAGDFVLLCDQLAGHAHMKIFIRVPEPIVDHRIDKFSVANAVAGARLRQKIWAIGH